MKQTTEADVEIKRVEIMNDELDRVHAALARNGNKESNEWARARIEELQAVLVASHFVVHEGPAYDDGTDNEDMN